MAFVSSRAAADVPVRDRWADWAIRANLALGAVFVVSFLFFAWRSRFPVPYMDDWDWIAFLQAPTPFTPTLWRLHNEHLVVIPRLLLWLDFRLWGWPGYLTPFAGVLAHVAIAAVLIDVAFRRFDRRTALLLTGTILVPLFLTYQLQGLVFPVSVVFPLVTALATLAIWLMDRASVAATAAVRRRRLILSAGACIGAMLTLSNGLIVPLLLAGLAYQLRLSRRTIASFAVLGIAGVLLRSSISGTPTATFVASPIAIALFALAFLAGFVGAVSGPGAVVVGAISVVLAVRGGWLSWRSPRRGGAGQGTLIGIVIFGLASAALAAPGRAVFGLNNAAQSRYVILTCAYWGALVLLTIRPPGLRPRLARALVLVLPLLAAIALPAQILVGLVWAAKADHLHTAALALSTDVRDEEWIWRIHPLGYAAISPSLEALSAHHVWFMDFTGRNQLSPYNAIDTPSCGGELGAVDPQLAGQASVGLRVAGGLDRPGDHVRIVDSDGRIRGIAGPAPLVPYGQAHASDFVWAVAARLMRRSPPLDRQWRGFSARGSGPPYIAELLDSSGQLVCKAAVRCCSVPPPVVYPRTIVGETIKLR